MSAPVPPSSATSAATAPTTSASYGSSSGSTSSARTHGSRPPNRWAAVVGPVPARSCTTRCPKGQAGRAWTCSRARGRLARMDRLHLGIHGARGAPRSPASLGPVQSPLLLGPAARRILDAESALRLQRSAGNAAVAALLLHSQPVAGTQSDSGLPHIVARARAPIRSNTVAIARPVVQRDLRF